MAANNIPPYFHTVNPFSNRKKIFFFVEKKNVEILQRVLKQRHVICYEAAFWIENCRQIQNGGHYRPE